MLTSDSKKQIYQLLYRFWALRYFNVILLIIMPFVCLFIGMLKPTQYMAKASILIEEPAMLNPFLKDLAFSTEVKKRFISIETFVNSRENLLKIAKHADLLAPNLSKKQQDLLLFKLKKNLSVNLAGSNVVNISYKSFDKKNLPQVVNIAKDIFIKQLLAPQISSIQSSAKFLKNQIKIHGQELAEAEKQLATFKTKHADLLPGLHKTYILQLQKLQELLAEKYGTLHGAEAGLNTIESQLIKTNPVIGTIEEKLIKAKTQLAIYQSRYTNEHSKVQSLQRNINKLTVERENILREYQSISKTDIEQLKNYAISLSVNRENKNLPILVSQIQNLHTLQSEVDSLKNEIKSIEQQIDKLRIKLQAYGTTERQLNRLENTVALKTDIYNKLLKRESMASVTGDLGLFEKKDRVRTIEQAHAAESIGSMPSYFFFILGIILGGLMGVSISVLMELIDTTVKTREALVSLTGVQLITFIPKLKEH